MHLEESVEKTSLFISRISQLGSSTWCVSLLTTRSCPYHLYKLSPMSFQNSHLSSSPLTVCSIVELPV